MHRYSQHAVLAAHIAFALVALGLLTADLIAAEAAVTNGRMSPLNIIGAP